MAMAVIATNLGLILRDLGTSAAVIQKDSISQDELATAFWASLIQGSVIFVALIVFSPAISHFFDQPKLTSILLLLSISFPIASAGSIHQAILERRSEFKAVATIETSGSMVALCVALCLAWFGFGVYSLVGQALTLATITTGLLWIKSRWRPNLNYSKSDFQKLFSFSSGMTGYQLASYAFRNADSLIVGKILGATAAGVYSLANRIMLFPVQNISWATTRALFPTMSRLQNDTKALKSLFLISTRNVTFLCAPLMFGLAATSDIFIKSTLSEKWHEISLLMPYLSFVGFIQVSTGVTGPVFMATGKTRLLFILAIINAITHVAAYWLGASHSGNVGVAIAYLAASMIIAMPTTILCNRQLRINTFEYFRIFLPPTIGGVVVYGTCTALQELAIDRHSVTPTNQLLICSFSSLIAYTAYSIAFQRDAIKQFMDTVKGRI